MYVFVAPTSFQASCNGHNHCKGHKYGSKYYDLNIAISQTMLALDVINVFI